MKSNQSIRILSVLGVVLLIICIITSVVAIHNGNDLKEISEGFVQTSQMTAEQEVQAKKISDAKSAFQKYLAVSLLTFIAVILDESIIYMKILSNSRKE